MYWKSAHRNFCKKSGVGSGVVCSTLIGNARASVRGTDDKRCSHAFFMLAFHLYLNNLTGPGDPRRKCKYTNYQK